MTRILEPEWFVQKNGVAVSGAKVFFYLTGTTTKVTTYSDSALTTPNANPIICDASGKIGNVFIASTTYLKMVVSPADDTDPPTAPINTYDPVALCGGLGQSPTDGSILTGQGSTSDVTCKNDAGAEVWSVPTGSTKMKFAGIVQKDGTHPAVLAYVASTISEVTGNGTAYTVVFDTEAFDQGTNQSGSTFTAPVTGKYQFNVGLRLSGITGAASSVDLRLITSNRSYQLNYLDPQGSLIGGQMNVIGGVLADMDASDTATLRITVSGEASDVVDIIGDTTLISFMSINLAV